jgi:hypothetical protein
MCTSSEKEMRPQPLGSNACRRCGTCGPDNQTGLLSRVVGLRLQVQISNQTRVEHVLRMVVKVHEGEGVEGVGGGWRTEMEDLPSGPRPES